MGITVLRNSLAFFMIIIKLLVEFLWIENAPKNSSKIRFSDHSFGFHIILTYFTIFIQKIHWQNDLTFSQLLNKREKWNLHLLKLDERNFLNFFLVVSYFALFQYVVVHYLQQNNNITTSSETSSPWNAKLPGISLHLILHSGQF